MSIFLVGEREELDKIETKFQWIKANLGINKTELYKEALIWISNNEKAKIKFMEHLIKEKAQEHQLFISK
jgi:hypothetical protein